MTQLRLHGSTDGVRWNGTCPAPACGVSGFLVSLSGPVGCNACGEPYADHSDGEHLLTPMTRADLRALKGS